MVNLCWHKWGEYGKVIPAYSGSLHQARKCKKCGAVSTRKVVGMFTAQLEAPEVNQSIEAAHGIKDGETE